MSPRSASSCSPSRGTSRDGSSRPRRPAASAAPSPGPIRSSTWICRSTTGWHPGSGINLWTFRLPGLSARPEDIEPNLEYELDEWAARHGHRVTFNKEARAAFLRFATSPEAGWAANFRDFNAAVVRMATLAAGGRITTDIVRD